MTQDESYKSWGVVGCGRKGKGEKGTNTVRFLSDEGVPGSFSNWPADRVRRSFPRQDFSV